METITYSLKDNNSKEFYNQLSVFSNKIISEAKYYFSADIEKYKNFLNKNSNVEILSDEEYLLEFIISGVFLGNYSVYAVNSKSFSTSLIYKLYAARIKYPNYKSVIDTISGYLAGILLYSKKSKSFQYTPYVFTKLIKWLMATGQFTEEIKRLKFWNQFYHSIQETEARVFINKSISFARYFTEQGKIYLGEFTKNVNSFLEHKHTKYKYRESYTFNGRSEAEYHLNMFSAEILNRKFRLGFTKTSNKIVLLPTCMCNPLNGECKATAKGFQLKCNSCNKNCEVNRIQNSLRKKGIETCLVQHSSNFSDTLKHWQNQDKIGLVGVGCVLNIIRGGYEMQNLHIPSQCVLLDYCGCKNHWHDKGFPTSLNRKQLEKIISDEGNTSLVYKENPISVETCLI